jgi:hypothetical protein
MTRLEHPTVSNALDMVFGKVRSAVIKGADTLRIMVDKK